MSRPRATSGAAQGAPLERLYSGRYIDDQANYHNHHFEQDDSDTDDTLEEREDPAAEVRDGIMDARDKNLEASLEKTTTSRSSRSRKNPNLVTWDGPDDQNNPKNWTTHSKWAAVFVVSSFTFISPVSSSMVAPALTSIAREFNITNEIEISLTLSIFVLAYAIGPLFLGPLSEIYGRVPVLQLANLFYLAFNIACGESTSKGQMIAFRFLSGLGGSAPLALGGGVMSDCFRAEERGKAIGIYSLAPLLGPAIGPIAGGFISENTSWRWIFRATSIADALIQIVGFFFLRETYAPKILLNKAKRLRKETGNDELRTEYEHPEKTLWNILKTSLSRPFILLGTQIIVQVLAVYMAFLYGMMYLVLSTFPSLWEIRYGESIGIGGLNYISLGVGFFLGSQITARMNDKIYKNLKKKNNGEGKPEFRVPMMPIGAALVPAGLFVYGWTAQYKTHWIGPNIGACMFAAGTIIGFQCIQTYIVDSYTRYAASAVGAATVLRSLAGFGFPLFAPYLYAKLQYGWGNSLLGFIGIAIGIPAPFMLWNFGAKLRAKSTFAAGGDPK